ncbi:DUF2334 domain-containing protein [Candidatus Neomarinimicrobiota bacterium]
MVLLIMQFILVACVEDAKPQILVNRATLQAGKVYELEFLEEMDELAYPSVLDSQELLLKSPLKYFAKKAFIIKADDLKAVPTDRWKRYFDLIADSGVPSTAGVITKYFTSLSSIDSAFHRNRIDSGIEYWHHGWDHQLDDNVIEFRGTSYDHQYTHLRDGIDIIKDKLDYTIHAFGAPGNAWDTTTVAAISNIPEIKVWLFGDDLPGKISIPMGNIVEQSATVYELSDVQRILAGQISNPVVMFQIHPNSWDDDNFDRFKIAMDYLVEFDSRAFMTAYEYFKLDADRDNIIVDKVDRLTYHIDLTAATYDHDIQIEAPFTIQEL